MSEPQDSRHFPLHQAGRDLHDRRGEPLAGMSEVGLLLALAETGDIIDTCLTLQSEGADMGAALLEACADLVDIEDELMLRGFSHRILCAR